MRSFISSSPTMFALALFCSSVNAQSIGKATTLNVTSPSMAISASNFAHQPWVFEGGATSQPTWSGSLTKRQLNQTRDGKVVVAPPTIWDAGALLTTQQAPDQRVIITYNEKLKRAISFEFGKLPGDVQAVFNRAPDGKSNDDLGVQRAAYIRGDRNMERNDKDATTPPFYPRLSLLGNINHRAPVYLGAPDKTKHDAGHHAFHHRYKTRPGAVFVSANDGMVHGFSAESGKELFAYIPSPFLKQLPALTFLSQPLTSLKPGNVHVADAQIANQWKTVLVAGMGERAPGVFALDVTTPYSFSANNGVLFEFTDNDDPDIGHVIAAPSIANVAVGKNKDGSTVYKYFAMVSGGHPTDDRSRPACVFLLALDKNLTTPWIPKVNYHKICLPSHSMVARDALSGLGLVMDANAAVRYAYAGDRYGRLWRFSFTGNDLTKVTPQLLFEATDSRRQTQAISATPVVAFGPDYGYTVLFGTGSTVAPVNALEHNSFYAVFDSMHDKNLPLTRINLAHRELRVSSATGKTGYKIEGSDFTYGTATEDKSGWYIDYPTHLNVPLLKSDNASFCTERSVAEGIVHFELVYFNTLLPSGTHCDQAGLSASYALNVLTGKTRSNDGITGFQTPRLLLGAPLIITLANTGGDTDAFGRRHFIQHDAVLNFGGVPSHGVGEAVAITTPLTAGRLSWREVQNWEDSQSKASP